MMTLKDWQSRPELAMQLREEMEKPIWKLALEIVESLSPTRKFSAAEPFLITPNGSAMAGQMIGYARCQANLALLTMPPADAVKKLTESYGINKPEQATE